MIMRYFNDIFKKAGYLPEHLAYDKAISCGISPCSSFPSQMPYL